MKLEYQGLPNYRIILHDNQGNKAYLCTVAYDDSWGKIKEWHVFDIEDELNLTFEELHKYFLHLALYLQFDFAKFRKQCRSLMLAAFKDVSKNGITSFEKYKQKIQLNQFISVDLYIGSPEREISSLDEHGEPIATDYKHIKLLDLPAEDYTVQADAEVNTSTIPDSNEEVRDSRFTIGKSVKAYADMLLKHLVSDMYFLGSPDPEELESSYYIHTQKELDDIVKHDREVLNNIKNKDKLDIYQVEDVFREQCYLSYFYDEVDYEATLDSNNKNHLFFDDTYYDCQIDMGEFDWMSKILNDKNMKPKIDK